MLRYIRGSVALWCIANTTWVVWSIVLLPKTSSVPIFSEWRVFFWSQPLLYTRRTTVGKTSCVSNFSFGSWRFCTFVSPYPLSYFWKSPITDRWILKIKICVGKPFRVFQLLTDLDSSVSPVSLHKLPLSISFTIYSHAEVCALFSLHPICKFTAL